MENKTRTDSRMTRRLEVQVIPFYHSSDESEHPCCNIPPDHYSNDRMKVMGRKALSVVSWDGREVLSVDTQ